MMLFLFVACLFLNTNEVSAHDITERSFLMMPDRYENISCPSITIVYKGKFRAVEDSNYGFDARFQFKLVADVILRKVYMQAQHWDEDVTNPRTFRYWYGFVNEKNWKYLHVQNHTEVIQFGNWIGGKDQSTELRVHLDEVKSADDATWFQLYWQPDFNLSFNLKNAIGQCTNQLPVKPRVGGEAVEKLFSACACCGDYLPDPLLLCPKSFEKH
ncbi:hypothetical protein M3Y97_00939000 [Aphelenchoides bicaudatus]|nr:hypothetical protein M3Y97_00939000 [Aphelenchoides bicaudatus]